MAKGAKSRLKPRFDHVKVSKIFITHLHGDHIFGLPGFLSSHCFQANERQTDLEIYSPQGSKSFNLNQPSVCRFSSALPNLFHEFDNSLRKILETEKFTVYAEELDHYFSVWATVSCKKDLEGTLDAEKLRLLVCHLDHSLKSKTVRDVV